MGKLDNMNLFIRSIILKDNIKPQEFDKYPLNIKALKLFVSLRFTTPVTIFNGENGCGKSTIIEAIASNLRIPVWGGNNYHIGVFENYDNGEENESELEKYLLVDKGFNRPYRTFFFRGESFYKIADIIARDKSLGFASKRLLKMSHGESFMNFLNSQICENSLYILDEPEAALSPINQLKLMTLIDKYSKKGSQFIIVSHSPFILGYSDAKLINLDGGMKEIKFKQTKIYNIYKSFLDNPKEYQEKFFEEEEILNSFIEYNNEFFTDEEIFDDSDDEFLDGEMEDIEEW